MKKSEIVSAIREGLDEMCVTSTQVSDPEWAKMNAVRFMENYRIMRSIEADLDNDDD